MIIWETFCVIMQIHLGLIRVLKCCYPLNKLSLNIAKTEYILIASRHMINKMDVLPTEKINNQHIKSAMYHGAWSSARWAFKMDPT